MSMQTATIIREQAGFLADAIVAQQYALQPEVWASYGGAGRAKSARDARYLLDYLADALAADAPELFIAYLEWASVLFAGLHFPPTVLLATLACTRQALEAHLAEEQRSDAMQLLDQGLRHLETVALVPASYLAGDAPLTQLGRAYLDALLAGERQSASRMILAAVEDSVPVKDIYLHVFQPAQWEVGRLWQINQISVAQEHYCTAAAQMIMSQLYPHIFAGPKKPGHTLVATCVGGELHEIGARMVADFFEMDGWNTCFLGANMPAESILRMAGQQRAGLLAISATMTFHVEGVRDLIAEARRSGLALHILVGGYPFNRAPELWKKIGADGYAPDAQAAIQVAESWLV